MGSWKPQATPTDTAGLGGGGSIPPPAPPAPPGPLLQRLQLLGQVAAPPGAPIVKAGGWEVLRNQHGSCPSPWGGVQLSLASSRSSVLPSHPPRLPNRLPDCLPEGFRIWQHTQKQLLHILCSQPPHCVQSNPGHKARVHVCICVRNDREPLLDAGCSVPYFFFFFF